jgi:hypothetical protein
MLAGGLRRAAPSGSVAMAYATGNGAAASDVARRTSKVVAPATSPSAQDEGDATLLNGIGQFMRKTDRPHE